MFEIKWKEMDFILCRSMGEHVSLKGMKIMEIDEKQIYIDILQFQNSSV